MARLDGLENKLEIPIDRVIDEVNGKKAENLARARHRLSLNLCISGRYQLTREIDDLHFLAVDLRLELNLGLVGVGKGATI